VVKAYPRDGGAPAVVCESCFLSWPRDRKSLFLSFTGANFGDGKTFVMPLAPGKAFPVLPERGLNSEADIQKVPGVRVIDRPIGFPGSSATTYAFEKRFVQRNLYRISLP
jgi:hypothetical protein